MSRNHLKTPENANNTRVDLYIEDNTEINTIYTETQRKHAKQTQIRYAKHDTNRRYQNTPYLDFACPQAKNYQTPQVQDE